MVDGPLPDSRFEIGFILLVVVLVLLAFPTADATARFVVSDTAAFFQEPSGDTISFRQSDVDFINEFEGSLGSGASSAERLFCGTTRNNRVTSFKFADVIISSDITSVSGVCKSEFGQRINLIVHTQPGSGELSREDKNLESELDYTCIAFEEVAVSPVSGQVSGLKCWEVSGSVENPVFTEVPVVVE